MKIRFIPVLNACEAAFAKKHQDIQLGRWAREAMAESLEPSAEQLDAEYERQKYEDALDQR